jgi:hypothetical protein
VAAEIEKESAGKVSINLLVMVDFPAPEGAVMMSIFSDKSDMCV